MKTVLAHGCFDLLHLGHIKHLQEARRFGDRLIVSVTDDQYVNKGIGRPRFTAEQRAAALRALKCVDEVHINAHADATPAIAKFKPSVYVKGYEYEHDSGASLAAEKAAVEAVGGKLVFTNTEKFSSSNLLKPELFAPEVVRYLDLAKAGGFRDIILRGFDDADKLKIFFIGETIIDEYRYVRGLGKSSKEMMLATVEAGVESFEGGAIAASKHGEWKLGEWMGQAECIKKTRYVDADFNRKLFDVYSARKINMSEFRRAQFRRHLREIVDGADVVVVMDFGHGLIGDDERMSLYESEFLAVNAQSNAGNFGFNQVIKYQRADFVCVDDPEARLATGMQDEDIHTVTQKLADFMECHNFLVTHGKFGSSWRSDYWLHGRPDVLYGTVPAFSGGGVDTMGAGDAVMAVTAPLVAAKVPVDIAAFIGNIAGAIKTSIIGHRRHVNRQEIIQTVEALLA